MPRRHELCGVQADHAARIAPHRKVVRVHDAAVGRQDRDRVGRVRRHELQPSYTLLLERFTRQNRRGYAAPRFQVAPDLTVESAYVLPA